MHAIVQEFGERLICCSAHLRYTADFEDQLLASTTEYYARKSSEWIEGDGTPDYLMKAERALEAEKERVAAYLNSNTESKLISVVEAEILVRGVGKLFFCFSFLFILLGHLCVP